MAYQSPIFMSFTEPIIKHLKDKVDNETFRAIQKVGIEVDRDELIRALTYDRDQYEKGFRDGRMYRPPVQTNADRIRAMTDEELAEFMALNTDCYYCRAKDNDRCASLATTPCGGIWLDWLKQEADPK